MGQIQQYTLTAGTISPLRLDGGSRTVIRVDGNDVRIAYGRDLFGALPGEASQLILCPRKRNGHILKQRKCMLEK